jgi:hypothetical protein
MCPVNYDLTCWYLNPRRVMELVGVSSIVPELNSVTSLGQIDDFVRKNLVLVVLKDALTQWLRRYNPPTLGQLLIHDTPLVTNLFTHYSNYFCKGSGRVREAVRTGKTTVPDMEIYSKLDEFRPDQKIIFRFSHEHLTSKSAWTQLQGQRRLLVLGAATNATDQVIEAIPWIIASPLTDLVGALDSYWATRLEVFVDSIDNFERIRQATRSPRNEDLEMLRTIPEVDIKRAFAEIIGEPTVPRDWGESDPICSQAGLC